MNKTVSAMILTLLTAVLIVAFNIQATESSEPPETEWSRTYGGIGKDSTTHSSVVETSDGGYAFAGYTASFGAGSWDFWLVKVGSHGNAQWDRTYGGGAWDEGRCVIQTSDGGYALTGYTRSFGTGDWDFWLVKTDAGGSHEWNRTYGGTGADAAFSVVQTSDGGYAIAGDTYSFGVGMADFWFVKVDANGNEQWNKTIGGGAEDAGRCVIQTSDGGYALTGYTKSFGAGGLDFWLIKADSDGNMEWNKTYGGADFEECTSFMETLDGGYALAGWTYSFGAGSSDFWLVKVDSSGNEQWSKTYGGTNFDRAWSVVQASDGGYVIAGHTMSLGAGSEDMWLIKTNSTGHVEWNKTYGGTSRDRAYTVLRTSDGGYAIAGMTESFGAGSEDMWLVKLAPEEISATVDIDPDTLNLKSNGEWITVYIELLASYPVEDIDISTVMLNNTIPVDLDAPTQIGDYDFDGAPDLMVKFDRASIIEWLGIIDHSEDTGKSCLVTFTITGEVLDTAFEGPYTIKVLRK